MGHNSWIAKAKRIEGQQSDETRYEMAADALDLVEKWNADLKLRQQAQYGYTDRRHYPQFSPHIGAALRSGHSILRLLCPACECEGQVDLAKIVRPDDFPIGAIYDAMVCSSGRCRGDSPRPVPLGLFPAHQRDAEEAELCREIVRRRGPG